MLDRGTTNCEWTKGETGTMSLLETELASEFCWQLATVSDSVKQKMARIGKDSKRNMRQSRISVVGHAQSIAFDMIMIQFSVGKADSCIDY